MIKTSLLQETISRHILPQYGPGYSISIELDGKAVFKHYTGYANLDYDILINKNTVFSVASLAKQFTACCIALLASEKRIHLDDSIIDYLPELDKYAQNIKIRHLIYHTGGVREKLWLKHYVSSSLLSDAEIFNRQDQPFYDPGNCFIYSNTCYSLLANIVENVTGMTEHEFAKQKIFDPLHMDSTHFHQDPEIIIKNCATAYKRLDDGSYKLCDNRSFPSMGDDGLWTTADDLALWHSCLINKTLPGAPSELFNILFSSFMLNDGELIPYGFGFFYDLNDREVIWQHGDCAGWKSVMRVYLKKKLSIIVISNLQQASPIDLALDLENAVIKELFNLPEKNNFFHEYQKLGGRMNFRANTLNIRKVEHASFPNAKKQDLMMDSNFSRYVGSYYCTPLDTCFEITAGGNGFNMKYAGKDEDAYNNLIDFSDANRITARVNGDWGGESLPIEFYGSDQAIGFFVLQDGCSHFYFVKCK